LLLVLVASVYAQTRVGTVFSMTNEPANRLVAYPRNSDGTIGAPVYYNTSGLGTGLSPLTQPLGPQNPFDTQHAVIRNNAGTRVYCVNAGSNSVSAFVVDQTGNVALARVYDSGGEYPTTLAISPNDQTLYVVNTGAQARLVSIPVGTGRGSFVTKINGAVTLFQTQPVFPQTPPQSLSSPGDVVASPDGRYVLVSEKAASTVSAYRVASGGKLLPRERFPPVVWHNPRAFSWPLEWVDATTLLVGGFGPDALNDPSYATVLSWNANTAVLTPLNELTLPTSANCWFSRVGNYFYGGSIIQFLPAFRIDPTTKVAALITPPGLTAGHAFDGAIGYNDMYGIDGYVYNLGWLDAVPHTMYGFRINTTDGSATLVTQNNAAPITQGCTAI